jgi:hemoglobin
VGYVALGAMVIGGCANEQKKNDDFFTSGSREADQRAAQRIAKDQQIHGKGEGSAKGADSGNPIAALTGQDVKKSLYDRLGGNDGLVAIVDDFVTRALADPRVNWERKGVKRSVFSLSKTRSVEWKATNENVAQLKKHLVQFLALATGGPAQYDGKEMGAAHADLQITNPEFDAAVGDLKATLDKLQIPTSEQKELLAIIESTRPQVVTVR